MGVERLSALACHHARLRNGGICKLPKRFAECFPHIPHSMHHCAQTKHVCIPVDRPFSLFSCWSFEENGATSEARRDLAESSLHLNPGCFRRQWRVIAVGHVLPRVNTAARSLDVQCS